MRCTMFESDADESICPDISEVDWVQVVTETAQVIPPSTSRESIY